jgi:hypothetical protein
LSYRIFAEDTITPTTRSINLRNNVDSTGPHLITFGVRCVVADATAGSYGMSVNYETPNGQLRTISLDFGGVADLSTIIDANGAMWYSNQVLMIDKRHPLGDGVGADPYGTMTLDFSLGGIAATSKISYECIISVFDDTTGGMTIP